MHDFLLHLLTLKQHYNTYTQKETACNLSPIMRNLAALMLKDVKGSHALEIKRCQIRNIIWAVNDTFYV